MNETLAHVMSLSCHKKEKAIPKSLPPGNMFGNLLDPGPVDLQRRGDLRRREDSLREELFDILLTTLLTTFLTTLLTAFLATLLEAFLTAFLNSFFDSLIPQQVDDRVH